MMEKGLALPLENALALRFQHRHEMHARMLNARSLAGALGRVRARTTQSLIQDLGRTLSGEHQGLAKGEPPTCLQQPLFGSHFEDPVTPRHDATASRLCPHSTK